jgi:hypothetical protein
MIFAARESSVKDEAHPPRYALLTFAIHDVLFAGTHPSPYL